ncbi:peptidoglycan-binding domain-containing protein [Streptomyces yunnanensis]|uniref:peptidoglycan-binding domain-containing protein n=1 Tax=Streptomyces yunnanensis TaxID=156453 RepID=UPI0025700092|nr:peptidoglycan-binding domain-containing protein [Streptomyces yunnanensis]
MKANTTGFKEATDEATSKATRKAASEAASDATGAATGTGAVRGVGRALRRTGTLAATAGLLTAGLLTGPAVAAGPAGRADSTQPATFAACAFYNGDALTVYGQHGDRVKQAQCLLANRHYLTWKDVTGNFGAKTRTAVTKFQTAHHLAADGKVGKGTWRALYS